MNPKEQDFLLGSFHERMRSIITSKREDYANDVDVLINFKRAGIAAGGSAAINILNLMGTKIARIAELTKGKVPNHESVEDSLLDLANYCFLMYCVLDEEAPVPESSGTVTLGGLGTFTLTNNQEQKPEPKPEPRSVQEWLEQIEDEGLREKAIYEAKKQGMLGVKASSIADAVNAFTWVDTNHGYYYWASAKDHLTKGTPFKAKPNNIS
jgi:hypothetical protein